MQKMGIGVAIAALRMAIERGDDETIRLLERALKHAIKRNLRHKQG